MMIPNKIIKDEKKILKQSPSLELKPNLGLCRTVDLIWSLSCRFLRTVFLFYMFLFSFPNQLWIKLAIDRMKELRSINTLAYTPSKMYSLSSITKSKSAE